MSFLFVITPTALELSNHREAKCDWLLCDDDRSIIEKGACTLEGLPDALNSREFKTDDIRIVGVIPDEHVLFTRLNIPARSTARIRQAAPFAIEPFLTTDLSDMHIAVGDHKSLDGVATVAINKEVMDSYKELHSIEGFSLFGITTLSLLTYEEGSAIRGWLIGDRFTLVTKDQMAVVDASTAVSSIEYLTRSSDEDEYVNFQLFVQNQDDEVVSNINVIPSVTTTVEHCDLAQYVLDYFDEKSSLNLLQGEFETKASLSNLGRKWMNAYVATFIVGLFCALVFATEGFWAQSKAKDLLESSIDLFEERFGSYNGLDNPAYLLQKSAPGSIGSDNLFGDFLTLLSRNFRDIEMIELRYVDATKNLVVEIKSRDFAKQERLRDALIGEGLSVEFSTVEQRDGMYHTSVQIRRP